MFEIFKTIFLFSLVLYLSNFVDEINLIMEATLMILDYFVIREQM